MLLVIVYMILYWCSTPVQTPDSLAPIHPQLCNLNLSTTMEPNASKTLKFTQEHYSRIILKDSLFSSITEVNVGISRNTLEKLQDRETRLFLHAVTLSDYIRVKIIPRSLKIDKGPIIGKDNDTFWDRCYEILNKCSYDLIALTIQEVSTNLAQVCVEMSYVKQQSSKFRDPAKLKQLFDECEYHKNELVKEITEI